MPRTRQSAPYAARRRWTIDDARMALAAHVASGLSARAFARREGIDVQRLGYWRRRIEATEKDVAPPPHFVEVRPRATSIVEVVLVCGRVLRVPESIDTDWLVRIVDAVDRPPSC